MLKMSLGEARREGEIRKAKIKDNGEIVCCAPFRKVGVFLLL